MKENLKQNEVEQLLLLFNQEKLFDVIKKAKILIKKYPNSAFLLNILGVASARLNKLSNAKKYFQSWENNMSVKSKPSITKCYNKPYTKIVFKTDFLKFGMKYLDEDIILLMKRRVYDMTACTSKKVSVYLNNVKSFTNWIKSMRNNFF